MVTCSYCEQPSVSAHMVRVGSIPTGWTHGKQPEKTPDKSHLQVVRVCTVHKQAVPR